MPDYLVDQPIINIDPDTGMPNPDDVEALVKWLADRQGFLPDVHDFDPAAGVPHFVRDGARFFAILGAKFIQFYIHHATTINPYLSAGLVAAMAALENYLGEIITIDQAGPN